MAEPALDVDGLRRRYGDREVVAGVSFAVHAGEVFGLLGPNGAGKTSTIAALAGLAAPTGGTVRLFGRPFDRGDADQRRLVGLATQDLAVYPDLTARENLTFFARLYGLRGGALRARVAEALDEVGLLDRADDRAGTFSGGMKRRLNLAVAVVHGPRVVFLDEPTTGVDPQSRNRVFDRVRALAAGGAAVVYTSHYMEEVQALCSRIGVMDAGRLIACDTLGGLLRRLDGEVRLHVAGNAGSAAARLAGLDGVKTAKADGGAVVLACPDAPAVLPRALETLRAAGVTVARAEAREPDLERVFLHLTGHALRD